jgi:thiol-disulfide isomerase/thioredoxin
MNWVPAFRLWVILAAAVGTARGGVAPSGTPRLVQPFALDVPAPTLEDDAAHWLNTGGKAVTFERGRVYVVEFWTYGCINCQRNLPAYARWHRQFAPQQLTIIGIHTPETEAERQSENVRNQVQRLGIRYPVLLDPDRTHWERWQQHIWPTVYLVDKRGRVRYRWIGELEWQQAGGEAAMTRRIQELLAEPTPPIAPPVPSPRRG